MNRQPVTSSDIKSIGYSESEQVLEVEFRSGGIYQYANFSESDHAALMSASSKGKHFHRRIKDRYSTTRIR